MCLFLDATINQYGTIDVFNAVKFRYRSCLSWRLVGRFITFRMRSLQFASSEQHRRLCRADEALADCSLINMGGTRVCEKMLELVSFAQHVPFRSEAARYGMKLQLFGPFYIYSLAIHGGDELIWSRRF